MLRLLGILSLGNLLFGGRHHGRMLRRGLLFGALFGFLAHNDFDMNRVEEDIRNTAEKVKSTVSGAAKTAKQEMREARKAEHDQRVADHLNKVHADMEARKAEHDRRMAERMEAIRAEAEARRAARAARRADRENARPSRQITALPECNGDSRAGRRPGKERPHCRDVCRCPDHRFSGGKRQVLFRTEIRACITGMMPVKMRECSLHECAK